LISSRPSPWSRREIAALAAIVLALFAWDLWAVLVDQRLRGTDSFVEQTLHCADALARTPSGCVRTGLKGPIAGILSVPALLLLDNPPASIRLTSVFAHLVLTLQMALLAARLWGNPRAGLWAALAGGAHPLVVGLFRLTHHDVLVAVAVAATLRTTLRLAQPRPRTVAATSPREPIELDRFASAATLGLVLGLGILVKPSFATYAVFPVLWLAAYRLRTWRRLLHLAFAGAAMLAALIAFALLNDNMLVDMLGAAVSGTDHESTAKLAYYARLPGVAGLYLVATGAMAALLLRRAGPLWIRVYLLQYLVMLFALVWLDRWSRFLLPILPLAAVLVGIGLAWLQETWREPARAGLLASVMLLVLVGSHAMTQLASGPATHPRERGVGMMVPDRRAYDAYPRALAPLLAHDRELVLVFAQVLAADAFKVAFELWQHRGPRVQLITREQADRRLAAGRTISVMQVSCREGTRWIAHQEWFDTHRRRSLLGHAVDPDGLEFSAFRVFPTER
jgi:hypothetical protein